MKKIGVLVIGREYFVPYVSWLTSMDGTLFDVVGYIDNEDPIYASAIGPSYTNKRNNHTVEELAQQCDLVLSISYWRIIPKKIIDLVPLGILNLHNSYLLSYRGRHAASWVIINGEVCHGTTLHYMSERLDDGPILASEQVAVLPNDTAHSLFFRVNDVALNVLKKNLPIALDEEKLKNVELLRPSPNYRTYKKVDLKHEIPAELLNSDPEKFYRCVRALTFPGMPKPYVNVAGGRIYLSAKVDK